MEPRPLFQTPKSNTYMYDDLHIDQIPTTPGPASASDHQKTTLSGHEETATVTASDHQGTVTASDHQEAINLQPPQDPPTSSPPTTVSSTPTCTGLPSSARLSELRRASCSRRNFAKKIAVETYTREELYTSNVNGKLGKKQLDPVRMAHIIETVLLSYPLEHGEKMEKALRDCRHAIDEYGRELHRQEKDKNNNF